MRRFFLLSTQKRMLKLIDKKIFTFFTLIFFVYLCADALADLSLLVTHIHIVGFRLSRTS